jgi:iron(III) transport system ATP-binding protein
MIPLLKVQSLYFNFHNAAQFKGLNGISLEVEAGKITVIIGESGCGKSTLLRCINGFHDLEKGSIHLEDHKVYGPAYNLVPGHPDIQYVSQDALLLENHTVEENILDKLNGYADVYKIKTIQHLIKILGLQGLEKQKPKFLSSGQKQRLSIARALAGDPKLYLLDEPFTNLDYPTKRAIWQTIFDKVKKKKTAVILVTHLPDDVWEIADEVLAMDEGKIIQQGRVEDVYYQAKNKYVAQILGEYSLVPRTLMSKDYKGHSISKNHFLIRPQQIVVSENKKGLKIIIRNKYKTASQLVKYIGLLEAKVELVFYSEKQLEIGAEYFISIAQNKYKTT